jgi:prolyl oligopeptidase
MKKLIFLTLISFTLMAQIKYPNTTKTDVSDVYFGVPVEDPYRWLEKSDSSAVADWVRVQNDVTNDYMNQIPFRTGIRKRLNDIWNYPKSSVPFKKADRYFFFKNNGLQNQSVLFTYKKGQTEKDAIMLLDPNTFSADGTASLSGYSVSKDGKYLAYSISEAGSDWNTIYVLDIEKKEKLKDELKWVKFSGLTWQGNGFYYNKYDKPNESKAFEQKNEFQKVCFHQLNTPQTADKVIYEDKKKPLRNFGVSITEDESYLLLYMYEGAASSHALWYKDLKKKNADFKPIVAEIKNKYSVIDNIGTQLLIVTNDKAPKNKLVLIDPLKPEMANWKTIIPEHETEVLNGISLAGTKMIANYTRNACSAMKIFSTEGKFEKEIALPTLGNIDGISAKKGDNEVFFGFSSFVYPSTVFRYDMVIGNPILYKKSEINFNSDEYETKQVFYPSKDGTKVSMFITHRKGLKLDGKNPTLLYGYGGFNISVMPSFSLSRLILLENDGVLAVANLRGGSEYGEKWHEDGMLLKKQNVFDDFAAAAEFLINEKYTSPEYLAASGRSNGGLLVGATINQRPDLFKVAFPAVGVMDMLRFHKFTIGWAWVPEYGSSETEVHFRNLLKFSPIHNISSDKKYPAVMVQTADHDDRVVPAHSYKYIATLQEKYKGENPVLIRIEVNAGHGAGKPTAMQIEDAVDMWAFMFYNMGITPKYK